MRKLIFAAGFLFASSIVMGQAGPTTSPSNAQPQSTNLGSAPPDQQSKKINVSSDVMQGLVLSKEQPIYPAIAKAAHVQGVVVLSAEIDTTGHITDVRVISGPAMLLQASIDAAKKWVYKPYLLNGIPIIVDTQINVVFSLRK